MSERGEERAIALSAGAIYASAMFVGLVEDLIPGGPEFSLLPGFIAMVIAPLVLLFGPRLSRGALAPLGPIGAAVIAFALATTHGYADSAVLYMWPVLWMAHFYGRRGTIFIVLWTGLVHGIAVLSMPGAQGNADRWIDVMVSVVVVGGVVRALSARSDRLVERLVSEARVDPLTGLLNRRGFQERMDVELSRALREQSPLAAVAIDIDHFKRVNDDHGHELGDRVLTWLGALIGEQVRAVDVAARLGGEEFVLVLPGADADEAETLAERIRGLVGEAHDRARFGISGELSITVSAGVAAMFAPVDSSELVAAADEALYAAKRGGRDRTVTHPGAPRLAA
jgi:diguanylate cyclase (GGDEF)-like protein